MPSTTDGGTGDGPDEDPRHDELSSEEPSSSRPSGEERREEEPPAPRDGLAMDALRLHAVQRATQRVDADLAREQDEALPHLAVTALATCAFLVVAFALARMTDGLWWIGPVLAAGATGMTAAGYARTAADRPRRRPRLRRPTPRSVRNRPD
ncbi:hypothetical protein [Streptomyces sp. NPDC048349]|uniref:hypothetical protein n=1 Tax=Streptomyces sp. NPDC048349 TaxID=3155486 RepID=UPI003431F3FA